MTAAPAAPPATRSRIGVVALVLGIVALVLAFIPFASYVAWAVGIAAVIVGIVALVKAGAGRKGAAITGVVLGAIAVLASIVMSVVYTTVLLVAAFAAAVPSGLPTAVPTAVPTPSSLATETPKAGDATVVYRVRGSGRAESIDYLVADASGSGTDQVSKAALPWTKTVPIEDPSALSTTVFSLTAQRGAGGGRITCEIEVDGKVISKHTSSGQYTVVSCSGTAG